MPMQLTVSRHRKRSRNYHSEGHGLSLTVELDQTLIEQPEKLQEKINDLYREVDAALGQQDVVWPVERKTQERRTQEQRDHDCIIHIATNGTDDVHGDEPCPVNGNRHSSVGGTPMSAAQRRAIDAISQRLDVMAVEQCQSVLGLKLDSLNVREASALIDHLLRMEQEARRSRGE